MHEVGTHVGGEGLWGFTPQRWALTEWRQNPGVREIKGIQTPRNDAAVNVMSGLTNYSQTLAFPGRSYLADLRGRVLIRRRGLLSSGELKVPSLLGNLAFHGVRVATTGQGLVCGRAGTHTTPGPGPTGKQTGKEVFKSPLEDTEHFLASTSLRSLTPEPTPPPLTRPWDHPPVLLETLRGGVDPALIAKNKL